MCITYVDLYEQRIVYGFVIDLLVVSIKKLKSKRIKKKTTIFVSSFNYTTRNELNAERNVII